MGMDTQEARIEAVSEVVYRWTPPAELQIAGQEGGARVRRIAEEMLAAVRRVDDGIADPPSQELIELRDEVQRLYEELDLSKRYLEESEQSRIALAEQNRDQATMLGAVEQARQRLIASSEQDGQQFREELARRDQASKEMQDRASVAEHDRDFYRARAHALQASLERLLSRSEMITQRKVIEDWAETMQEARHTLSNGAEL